MTGSAAGTAECCQVDRGPTTSAEKQPCLHERKIDQRRDGGPYWCADCGVDLDRRVTGPTGDPLGAVEWHD